MAFDGLILPFNGIKLIAIGDVVVDVVDDIIDDIVVRVVLFDLD